MALAWRSLRTLKTLKTLRRAPSGVPTIRDGPGTTGRCCATAALGAVNAYANDISSYNRALMTLNFKRRHYLLRDVYDDMLVDGVQPLPQTFHLLLSGCMRGSRLQDAAFFFDQMKMMGVVPDIFAYSLLITACGKCGQTARAFRYGDEMEASGVPQKLETFVALLISCGLAGDIDKAFDVLRKMTTCGIAFNEYCYSALISAYKNKKPPLPDTFDRVLEILQKAKALSGEDLKARAATGEAEVSSDLQEEFCCLITGEAQMRRGSFNRRMMVYHAAFRACADLRNLEGLKKVHEILIHDRLIPDAFCVSQMIRGYIAAKDFDSACECFTKHINSGRPVNLDLYMVMIQGAMADYTEAGMTIAKKLLIQLNEKGFYLNPRVGSDLLIHAANETEGNYTTANLIWDMMERKKLKPTKRACDVYLKGLEDRQVPADDPRISAVRAASRSFPQYTDMQQRQGIQVPVVSMMSNRPPMRRQAEQRI